MCLSKVSVALTEKRGKEWVGVGYKVLDNLGGPDYKSKHRVNRWSTAKNMLITTSYPDYQPYITGFHIFIKQEDAQNYAKGYSGSEVRKVLFKEILGYGENSTGEEDGPCVIANKMLVTDEIVK